MNTSTKRNRCRICNKKLNPEIDPTREQEYINKSGESITRVYLMGECAQCASDRIVMAKWAKRGPEEIVREIGSLKRRIMVLKKVMRAEVN